MARRSQCSSAGDNPLDPNYLPPHYREEYRLAIDALIEADLDGYYGFLQEANVVDFLSRPEIEYIKGMVQVPCQRPQQDRRYMTGDGDGSSDTYWPMQSDLDAPALDLGWPQQHRFVGPTEITTLVNPSDPKMPSIKEQARRMIKNAQQVVAIAMDMFTDVDIFADILNAAMRNVAVYVLLDELNAHHFVAMVNNCRVNLDEIKSLRVRTVSGSTYFCQTGKSFKGQMMNRFILVDCKIVLSGNYSFMWSFEKIHRCIAHVFIGQFVATFDEEFRILYAQSEPLVIENAMTYVEDYANVPRRQKIENTNIFMREHLPIENVRAEWPGHSFEDPVTVQPNMLSFRRGESIHSSTDEQIPFPLHGPQQFRGEHPFLDQRRHMKGPNKDMGDFKRYGYTGVQNYAHVNTANRGEPNMEGLEMQSTHFPREQYFSQRPGPEPGYEIYGKPRDYSYHQDQYPGPDFPVVEMEDAEPPSGYDHVQRFLHSCPTVEKVPAGNLLVPVQSPTRRHSMGQSYTCQTSPTQPNLPEQKQFFNVHHKRQDQKEGLRDWRISSYLTALQHTGLDDTPELQRSDSFDNAPYVMQGRPIEADVSETRQDNSEFTKVPPYKNVQPLETLSLPEKPLELPASFRKFLENSKQTPTTSESSSNTEGDKQEEPKESNLAREESFRRRPNLALQRSSRLRHSLIFNSNLELHTSEDAINPSIQNSDDDLLKKSVVVSNMLEKKKPGTREPFQWSSLIKPSFGLSLDSTTKAESEDLSSKTVEESAEDKGETTEIAQKDSQPERDLPQRLQPQAAENAQTHKLASAVSQQSVSFMDMNDPDCRLRFFKELAAKRKAELAQANLSAKDNDSQQPDKSKKSLPIDSSEGKEPATETPTAKAMPPKSSPQLPPGSSQESTTKAPSSPDKNLKHKSHDSKMMEGHAKCDSRAIPTSATDAEKIKLKLQLSEEHDPSPKTVDDNCASVANPGAQLHTKPNLASQISIPNISSSEFLAPQTKLPNVLALGGSSLSSAIRPNTLKLSPTDSFSSQIASGASKSRKPSSTEPGSTELSRTDSEQKQVTNLSQHPTASYKELLKRSAPAETGSGSEQTKTTKHTPAAQTGLSQSPTGTGLAEKMGTAHLHTSAKGTGPSQLPSATRYAGKTCSDTPSNKTSPSLDPSTARHAETVDTAQNTTANKISPSEHPIAASLDEKADITPQATAEEPGPSQDPNAKSHSQKTDRTNSVSAEEPGPSQLPTVTSEAKKTDATHPAPAEEPGPSQDPTATSHTEKTDIAHPASAEEPGPSQDPTLTRDAENTDPTHYNAAKETGPSQPPNAAKTECSQHLTEDHDSNKQHSVDTAPATTSPPETSSDVSLVPTETGPATSTLQPDKGSEHIRASSEKNLPVSSLLSENAISAQTGTTPSAGDSPVETSSCSEVTLADDSSLAEGGSRQRVPEGSLTETTKTDGTSQNVSLTDASSLVTHSEPDDFTTECSSAPTQEDSSPEPGEASIEPLPPLNDSTPGPIINPSSVTDNQSHGSAGVQPVKLLEAEIPTAQDISCPTDPEVGGKNEDRKGEPTKEQTQQQEASAAPTSHEPAEAHLDLDNGRVNEIEKITTDGTSGGLNDVAPSQEPPKPEPPCIDSVHQQPPAVDKPTHQSSTIKVLSCSNLRDDTKVLLEQISAKNQGRASKMSLAGGCDTTAGETNANTNTNKEISGYLQSRSKAWTSKASVEEREKLLKRIESMRKEKRVYSRFEAP